MILRIWTKGVFSRDRSSATTPKNSCSNNHICWARDPSCPQANYFGNRRQSVIQRHCLAAGIYGGRDFSPDSVLCLLGFSPVWWLGSWVRLCQSPYSGFWICTWFTWLREIERLWYVSEAKMNVRTHKVAIPVDVKFLGNGIRSTDENGSWVWRQIRNQL